MLKKMNLGLTLAACVAVTPALSANIVTNGDFELADIADNSAEQAAVELTGWTVVSNTSSANTAGQANVSLADGLYFAPSAVTNVADPATNSAFEGRQYVAFNSWNGDAFGATTAEVASISQALTTEIGVEYKVEFSIAGAFSTPQAVLVDAGGIQSLAVDASSALWTTHSFNFVATDTSTTLTISDDLVAVGGNTTSSDLLVDAVSVTVVPEPGSLALLGLGGLLLARRRR